MATFFYLAIIVFVANFLVVDYCCRPSLLILVLGSFWGYCKRPLLVERESQFSSLLRLLMDLGQLIPLKYLPTFALHFPLICLPLLSLLPLSTFQSFISFVLLSSLPPFFSIFFPPLSPSPSVNWCRGTWNSLALHRRWCWIRLWGEQEALGSFDGR